MKKRFLLIGISIIILAALIWYAKPLTLAGIVAKSDINYIFFALMLMTISICTRVLKWKVLLNDLKFLEIFPVQMLGITISNFTPGKIAEPLKAVILKARKNISVSDSMPSIIWERIIDVIVLIIFSLIALQLFGFQSKIMLLSFISIGAFAFLIALLLVMLHNKNFGYSIFRRLRKLPIANRLSEDFMKNFYENKIKKKKLFSCLVFTGIAWFLDGVVFYLTLQALGITVNPLVLSGIIALSVLIGVASTLPGGLGSTETVMIILLGALNIQSATAVAGVMIFRFISFWYGIFIGGASFVYLSKKIDLKNII